MDWPLISCIMPTTGKRKRFVEQAIRLFLAQGYPNTELIIVDEHDAYGDCADVVPGGWSTIRYVWLLADDFLTVGMKRNIACSLARGEIICHFDDDDYYGPERLGRQIGPILSGAADFTAMRMSLLLDADKGELWTCTDETHRKCFKQDVHYGTLMYKAEYWRDGTQFASVQVGEDRRFVHALLAQDARLGRVVDPASFAYVLHGGNTTSDMRLVHADGWQQVPIEDYLPAEHRAFYASLQLTGVTK